MNAEFRQALEALDLIKLRRMWKHIAPQFPQPETDAMALAIAHHSRTLARSIPERLRCYSHCWLIDRGMTSGLPVLMRKKAEQMFPRVVDAVGISIGGTSEISRAIKPHVMRAMTDVVKDCYANGDRDPAIVKPRMFEARQSTIKKLLGGVCK